MTNYLSLIKAKEAMTREKKVVENINTEIKKVNDIDDIFRLLNYSPTSKYRIGSEVNGLTSNSHGNDYELNRIGTSSSDDRFLSRKSKGTLETVPKEYIMSGFNKKGRNVYRRLIRSQPIFVNSLEEYQRISESVARSWSNEMSKFLLSESGWINKEKKFQSSKFKIMGEKHSSFAEEIVKSLNKGNDFKMIYYKDGQANEAVKNIITIDLSEENE